MLEIELRHRQAVSSILMLQRGMWNHSQYLLFSESCRFQALAPPHCPQPPEACTVPSAAYLSISSLVRAVFMDPSETAFFLLQIMGEWVTKTLWSLLWLPLKISGGWIRGYVCVCVCMSLFKYNCISCLKVLNHVLKLTAEFDWKLSTWWEKLNLHSFRYLHTLHGFLPL